MPPAPSEKAPAAEVASDVAVNSSKTLFYCSLIAMTGFPLGWEVGHTGNLISSAEFLLYFASTTAELPAMVLGIIVSSFNLGCLVGCLAIPPLASRIGFKPSIVASSSVYAVGWLVQFLVLVVHISSSYLLFSGGRFLCGLCCGAFTVLGPIFISHQVLNQSRLGFYLSFFQVSICIFILIGNLLFFFTPDSLVAMITSMVFNLLTVLSVLLVPESNHYLLQRGNKNKIVRNFRKLLKIDHETQLMDKVDEFVNKTSSESKPFDIYTCMRCCLVMVFQQLTGINYFFYFAVIIFNKVLTVNLSNIPIIIMGIINLIGSFVSSKLILKYGPITLLKIGSICITVLLVIYSTIGLTIDNSPNFSLSIILIGISWVFVFVFAISWGPCSNLVINLISNNNHTIIGFAVFSNWMANFLITILSPIIIQTIGFGYGLIFGVSALVLIFFTEHIQRII